MINRIFNVDAFEFYEVNMKLRKPKNNYFLSTPGFRGHGENKTLLPKEESALKNKQKNTFVYYIV